MLRQSRSSTLTLISVVIAAVVVAGSVSAQERPSRRQARDSHFLAQSESLQIGTNTLGDLTADLIYTPLAQPCRIVDTRVAGGPLAPGVTRNFYAFEIGGTDISGQGGTSGGCGVPLDAAAVHMNFVAVSATGAGNLKGAAFGQPIPTTGSIINYASVSGLAIANGVNMPVCLSLCGYEFELQANVSSTQVVVDVLGYFRKHRGGFLHTTTVANVSGSTTEMDNAATNNNPNALLFITHNWTTNHIYDSHVLGVYYDTTTNKWGIFHEDGSAITAGETFNVLVVNP